MSIWKLRIDEYVKYLRTLDNIKEKEIKTICSKIYNAKKNKDFFEVGLAKYGL